MKVAHLWEMPIGSMGTGRTLTVLDTESNVWCLFLRSDGGGKIILVICNILILDVCFYAMFVPKSMKVMVQNSRRQVARLAWWGARSLC